MGLNFFKIIQKIESAFMFILLHGGLETIILFVFGEELYNKYKINKYWHVQKERQSKRDCVWEKSGKTVLFANRFRGARCVFCRIWLG